jgi:uncharacterized membrane protein YcjF (UPF0283 family)
MDPHKSASPSIRDMGKPSTTSRNKNNMMVDIELAEPKDESTTFATKQQQQHKKKKQCTTIKSLKKFAFLLCLDLAFMGVVLIWKTYQMNEYINDCPATGGQVVVVKVNKTFFGRPLRCEGLDGDVRRG